MKHLFTSIFLLLVLGFFQNCQLPAYHLKRQAYDDAFRSAAKRLDGKRQKTRHLQVLEQAFAAANERDLAAIAGLRQRNDRTGWERIHFLHVQMRARHERLRALLPLASEDGYRPRLRSYPVEEWEAESYGQVVEFYLQDIRAQLRLATATEKMPARRASGLLGELGTRYGWSGPEAQALADSCHLLGTTFILLDIQNDRGGPDGQRAADWLNEREIDLNRDWKELHRAPQPGTGYDLTAHLDIHGTYVSSGSISTAWRTVSKEVEVGQKEVRDTSGKVIGHEKIYATVCATITETHATKNASVSALLTIGDARTGALLLQKELVGSDCFSESGCSYSGDTRAVDVMFCSVFIPSPSFPSDGEMLRNSAGSLRWILRRELRRVGE